MILARDEAVGLRMSYRQQRCRILSSQDSLGLGGCVDQRYLDLENLMQCGH
jgi:hypothetical protein